MDNITHSLIGLATAKCANETINKDKDPKVSFFLNFTAIVAANFPDLDILYSLIDPGQLGYLLHHRGHTHTFLYLIPQIVLLFVAFKFLFKISDKKVLGTGFGLVIINMFLHIFMDYQNSYGVHPLAPFNNRWFYNDNLFIIEPLIWFSLLPLVFSPAPFVRKIKDKIENPKLSRQLLWVLFLCTFLGILSLSFVIGYLNVVSVLVCFALFASYLFVFNYKSETTKAMISLITLVAIINTFAFFRFQAHQAISQAHKEEMGTSLLDVVLTPMPANPLCWKFLLVAVGPNQSYQIVEGAFRNSIINLVDCPRQTYTHSVDRGQQLHQQSPVVFETTYSSSLKYLAQDLGDPAITCKRDEWLQFVRVPLRVQKNVYVDLRYERGEDKEANFTRIDVSDPDLKCVKYKVPWTPPRQDLIDLSLGVSG